MGTFCRLALRYNRVAVSYGLAGMQSEAQGAAADAKFGAVLQHRGADTVFFEESAVGGVQVFQVDETVPDFEQAMVARNLGIIQGHVGTFTADHRARFGEWETVAELRAAGHRKRCGDTGRQIRIFVDRKGVQSRGGRIGASKGRHWRDDDSFIDAAFDFHDGRFSALGAAELNLRMLGEHRVVEKVLLPTMNAAGLHNSKVTRRGTGGDLSNGTGLRQRLLAGNWRRFRQRPETA
jgi:hypothetical protein